MTAELRDLLPQLKGPRRSMGVHIPNLRGHIAAWESITPTRGAAHLCGFMSPYPQLKGPQNFVGLTYVAKIRQFTKTSPTPHPQIVTIKSPSSYQKKTQPEQTAPPKFTKETPVLTKKKTHIFPKKIQTLPKKNPKPYRVFFW